MWDKNTRTYLKSCIVCGEDFQTKEALKKYCSYKCERFYRDGSDVLSSIIRTAIFRRDNLTCQVCGYDEDIRQLVIHHRIQVSEGGKNDEDNLVTLCKQCHRDIHSRPLSEPEEGLF